MSKINSIVDKYLSEKYVDGFNNWGKTVEVFVNPSSKELKEIKDASSMGTIRFFANMKEKKIYMWNGDNAIHQDAIDNGLQPTAGFNYDSYALSGRHADVIFGGTIEKGVTRSDSWDASETAQYSTPDLAKRADAKTLKNVQAMAKNDFSWMAKYGVDPKAVKRMVDSLVDYLEEM